MTARVLTLVSGGKKDEREPRLLVCPKCAKCFKFPEDIEPPICPECKFKFPKRNQTALAQRK